MFQGEAKSLKQVLGDADFQKDISRKLSKLVHIGVVAQCQSLSVTCASIIFIGFIQLPQKSFVKTVVSNESLI